MRILITIAARGGSKGVKNKNIRELCGKPLIAWTIEQALKWRKADKVVVSTDSPAIAEAARRFGAEVPFTRPAELASDTAGKQPVLRHALLECERTFSRKYDWLVDLDATAPLRKVADIENAFNEAVRLDTLTFFSVVAAHKNPYFNMVEKDPAGFARLCKPPETPVLSRQAAPAVFDMNASIYVYKAAYLRQDGPLPLFTPRTGIYVMDDISGRDIDTEMDFQFVQYVMNEKLWRPDPD